MIPLGAETLDSVNVICLINTKTPASQHNWISKTSLRSKPSRVHFRDMVNWVLWVKFPWFLTLIHSILSTWRIGTCLGTFDNILKSFEPILPNLWHGGFAWLQPGL